MYVPEGERPAEDSQARGTSNEAGEQTEDDASMAMWGGGLPWGTVRPRCLLAMLCMMRAASFLAHNRKQSTPRDAGMLWLRLTFVGHFRRARLAAPGCERDDGFPRGDRDSVRKRHTDRSQIT